MIQKSLEYRVEKQKLFTKDEQLLLALSGGIDSIVLLHILTTLKYNITVAHCNFHLRGEDSNRDEQFVKNLCHNYGIDFLLKHFDTEEYAKENKISIELAARELRYSWFQSLLEEKDFSKLVVAHHANDSLETALYHFIKGTGFSGLKGINGVNENIIRPLLFATKNEIIKYAKEKKLTWVEDYTNQTNTYARNYIRNELIPKIKTINPNIENTFVQTSTRIQQSILFFEEQLGFFKQKYFKKISDQKWILQIEEIKYKPWFKTIVWEIFKEYNFSFQQIIQLSEINEMGKYISNKNYSIYNHSSYWILIKKEYTERQQTIAIENSIFDLNDVQYEIKNDKNVACIDFDKVVWPIKVRLWESGDFFYPITTKQIIKKNVSDFLNDLKIKMPEKKNIYVLTNENNEIMWVVGYRIDNRFKVDESTKKVIEFRVKY